MCPARHIKAQRSVTSSRLAQTKPNGDTHLGLNAHVEMPVDADIDRVVRVLLLQCRTLQLRMQCGHYDHLRLRLSWCLPSSRASSPRHRRLPLLLATCSESLFPDLGHDHALDRDHALCLCLDLVGLAAEVRQRPPPPRGRRGRGRRSQECPACLKNEGINLYQPRPIS